MTPDQTAELQALEAELATLRADHMKARKELARAAGFPLSHTYRGRAAQMDSAQADLESWNREHAARLAELRLLNVVDDAVGRLEGKS